MFRWPRHDLARFHKRENSVDYFGVVLYCNGCGVMDMCCLFIINVRVVLDRKFPSCLMLICVFVGNL